MNVFSKPLQSNDEISYLDFYKNNMDISKLKLVQLKSIAKKNKLPVSGTKPILISRVEKFFIESKSSSLIQKIFRGYLVRNSFITRGPAFKDVKKCVNDTDFITLDPLNEIPFFDFYSYQDSAGFIYGFSVSSLISLLAQKGTIINPYNREKIDMKNMKQVISLHRIKKLLFSTFQREHSNLPIENTVQTTNLLLQRMSSNVNTLNRELIERMREIQQKPLVIRVQELFMEIDQLGNYTQAAWFDNLSTGDYLRFYRYLSDIWNYRGQLSNEMKRNICSLTDPFRNNYLLRNATMLEHEQMKKICLNVMEHMIYTGIDIEYRKLGALHALSVLTIVSLPARQNMMWLYESLVF
jgi:SAP domain